MNNGQMYKKSETNTKPMTSLSRDFIEKLRATDIGDTFSYEGDKYEVTKNRHYKKLTSPKKLGGKRTRRKKATRRTRRKTSRK